MNELAISAAMSPAYVLQLKKMKNHKMEQLALKIVNNCLNTNIYSYLETSGGQSYNLYLNVVHCFNTSLN